MSLRHWTGWHSSGEIVQRTPVLSVLRVLGDSVLRRFQISARYMACCNIRRQSGKSGSGCGRFHRRVCDHFSGRQVSRVPVQHLHNWQTGRPLCRNQCVGRLDSENLDMSREKFDNVPIGRPTENTYSSRRLVVASATSGNIRSRAARRGRSLISPAKKSSIFPGRRTGRGSFLRGGSLVLTWSC